MTDEVRRRRTLLDRWEYILDVLAGCGMTAAGIAGAISTPPTLLREVNVSGLVPLWVSLLIVGGTLAAVGRLSGYWIAETVGIVASVGGALIYAAVVFAAASVSPGVLVAAFLLLALAILLAGRYVRLQKFLGSKAERSTMQALRALLTLRTTPRPRV